LTSQQPRQEVTVNTLWQQWNELSGTPTTEIGYRDFVQVWAELPIEHMPRVKHERRAPDAITLTLLNIFEYPAGIALNVFQTQIRQGFH